MRPLIIQILPRLTPGECGVSDYAALLAGELRAQFGIDSAFVVVNSGIRCDLPYAAIYRPVTMLPESCRELTEAGSAAILVHVSGYGYSPDGAPLPLADALRTLKSDGKFRTAGYFHETVASGPPWRSAFWHRRRQKKAICGIAGQCELVVTNTESNVEFLERESRRIGGTAVERMPVFSNAGEAEALVPFAQRRAAMLLFGLAGTRRRGYRKLLEAGDLIKVLGIREILDIGPECDHPGDVGGIPVRAMGQLPHAELRAVFSQVQFGYVSHPLSSLAKSGVFAAYCAQGTVPVLADGCPDPADGLQDGVQVVSARTAEAARRSGWESCSRAAWNWYRTHSLRVHAERYARWMGVGK